MRRATWHLHCSTTVSRTLPIFKELEHAIHRLPRDLSPSRPGGCVLARTAGSRACRSADTCRRRSSSASGSSAAGARRARGDARDRARQRLLRLRHGRAHGGHPDCAPGLLRSDATTPGRSRPHPGQLRRPRHARIQHRARPEARRRGQEVSRRPRLPRGPHQHHQLRQGATPRFGRGRIGLAGEPPRRSDPEAGPDGRFQHRVAVKGLPVRSIAVLLLLGCLVCAGAAGASEPVITVTVTPGARYQAGWLHSFFLGEHWREAWATPIEVPVLDLGTFDGGLRPDSQGGGLETKNLHFKSENGHTWAFRSVDKDPTRVLDPDTRESWLGDLYQDETSSAQPYGALVVPSLLDAAVVLHSTPQLAVLPDDQRLGEFQQHGGMLGLLEQRIERDLDGATKVADTITLFERLEKRSDERVDARAYLRARLIDILVGDWDRHVDQWRWARYDRDGERIWEPVPRDRDQAFSRFDGVVPSISEYYTKQLSGFGESYVAIDKLTFSGRYIDRRFLTSLEAAEWEAVTNELTAKLTDTVISGAVHRLPEEIYQKEGAAIEHALRSRRDALAAESREYYRLLADQVDVRGTAQNDEFKIDREASGAVEIAIYARDQRAPYFHRTF